MIGKAVDRIEKIFELRVLSHPGWVVVSELFVGFGWLRAAASKVGDEAWWSGDLVAGFLREHRGDTVGWYAGFGDLLLSSTAVVAAVVILAEVVIGVSLVLARHVDKALAAAVFLNINFVLVGRTNPSIFYLLLEMGLLLWLVENSTRTPVSLKALRGIAMVSLVLAALCLPWVRTLSPALVTDDPAAVLATWGLCTAVGASGARRRVRRRVLNEGVVDLRWARV